MAGCSWWVVRGGLFVESCSLRVVRGGCSWRVVRGGLLVEDCLWRAGIWGRPRDRHRVGLGVCRG